MRAYIGNTQYIRFDRQGYPLKNITHELDIQKTLIRYASCETNEPDIFHSLYEQAVIIDYDLNNALKETI